MKIVFEKNEINKKEAGVGRLFKKRQKMKPTFENVLADDHMRQ